MKMRQAEKLDIIVAFHNGAKYFGDQLKSIIESAEQAEIDFRVLVINDASKADETAELHRICAGHQNVQLITNEKNLGVIRSFERGLSESDADYFMLSDQDDFWLPEKVKNSIEALRILEHDKPALVFSDLCVVDQNLNKIQERMIGLHEFRQEEYKFSLLVHNVIAGCTIAINKTLRDLALPFPTEITMHDHWLGVCSAFAGHISYLNQSTILYRQHENNLVGSPKKRWGPILKHPLMSLNQINCSLERKSLQALALYKRLSERGYCQGNDDLIVAAERFRKLTPLNLIQLIRLKVFSLPRARTLSRQ
jgi:glycosyltransferase involved in cell wall biosynthesis